MTAEEDEPCKRVKIFGLQVHLFKKFEKNAVDGIKYHDRNE